MGETYDWSWLEAAVNAPEITLDDWLRLPEDVARRIEVENGRIVHRESPSPNHQGIQHNLHNALREATRKADTECHRVRSGLGVLFTEVPFHYRKPDVTVYRCVPDDRAAWQRWKDKPLVSDVLIAVEIMSQGSRIEDLQTKRSVYAAAGIPHYWIVRQAGDDGPAVTVEQLTLAADGSYMTEGIASRGKAPLAIHTINPLPVRVSWEHLDEDL